MLTRSAELAAISERATIRRAQQGDRVAFDELVRLYERNVLRLALQICRSPEEAQDLYQEAFLKVYRSLPRFRFESRFSTWLYRVVMNVGLDFLRRRSSRKEVQFSASHDDPDYASSVPEERAALDPEQSLRAAEIRQRLGLALDRLNPRERMVFELRHYQGLKLRLIGQMLGTSEETAKNCLFRATQKLRVELRELV